MKVIHKLTVHLDDRHLIPCIDAVQGDASTRVLELTLLSEDKAWTVPTGTVVSVAYRKGDGTSGWYDALPDGTPACSFSGNVITATLAPQVLTAPGAVQVAVVLCKPDTLEQLAVFPLTVEVTKNPAAGETLSNDYYNYSTMEQINSALGSAKPLWITISGSKSDGYTADKSIDDIQNAEESGQLCVCEWDGVFLPFVRVYDGVAYFSTVLDRNEYRVEISRYGVNALSKKIIDTYDFLVFPGGGGYVAEDTISDLRAVKAAGRTLVCVLETENQQLLSLPLVKEEGGAYHFSAVCEGVEWYVQIDGESNVQVSSEPLGGSAASVVVVEATYNWSSESGSMDEDNLAKIAAGYEAGSCVMLKIGTTLYSFLGPNGDMSNGWVFYNLVDNRLYTVCVTLDGGVYANEKRCFAPDGEGIMEYPETHAIFGTVEVPGDLVLGDNAVYLIAEVDEEQNKTLLHLSNNADTDGDVVLRGVEAGVEDTDAVNVRQLNTKITAPSIAEVGQTLVVKEVDENGKPASWECAELPGGEGEAWELISETEITTEDNITLIEFDGLADYDEAIMIVYSPWGNSEEPTAVAQINGNNVDQWYKFQRGTITMYHTFKVKRICGDYFEILLSSNSAHYQYDGVHNVLGTYKGTINKIGISLTSALQTGGYNTPCIISCYAR